MFYYPDGTPKHKQQTRLGTGSATDKIFVHYENGRDLSDEFLGAFRAQVCSQAERKASRVENRIIRDCFK